MLIIGNPRNQQELSGRWRRAGKRIGLVPTMGSLHEGHMSLVRASLKSCDRTVVSVFVNPIQFGPGEDLARYPRPFIRDCAMLRKAGVDAVFHPSPSAMYPPGFSTQVEVSGPVLSGLCSPFRPGHFRGVATVVAKLFNSVRPDAAYFGAKDFQQAEVVRRMAADLDMGIDIRVLPIIREKDGLAMSSRNAYLSKTGRRAATVLYRALRAGRDKIASCESDISAVKKAIRAVLGREPLARVEYLEISDAGTLEPLSRLEGRVHLARQRRAGETSPTFGGRVLMALAVRVEGTRLIDNMCVRIPLGRYRRQIRRK